MVLTMMAATALASAAPVDSPRVFEKVRDDGVTVVCVRHDRKPTIFTARTECREPSAWRRAELSARLEPISPRMVPDLDYYLTTPKPTPRLVGK